jgi:hypothetical protein
MRLSKDRVLAFRGNFITSAHPEMTFLLNICASPVECETYSPGAMLKKLIRQSSVANNASGWQRSTFGYFFTSLA